MGRICRTFVKQLLGCVILTVIFQFNAILWFPSRPCPPCKHVETSICTTDRNILPDVSVVRDLTTELNHTPLVSYDVLELMRRYGLNSTLLSWSVPRNSSDGDDFVVPNVIHFMHFGKTLKFEFRNYLTVLGVHKFMKPDYIIFHGDGEISGRWWNNTLADVPNLYCVWLQQPTEIHGRKMRYIQHAADITRLQTLYGTYRRYTVCTDVIRYVHTLYSTYISYRVRTDVIGYVHTL